jgi:hypothetical protein
MLSNSLLRVASSPSLPLRYATLPLSYHTVDLLTFTRKTRVLRTKEMCGEVLEREIWKQTSPSRPHFLTKVSLELISPIRDRASQRSVASFRDSLSLTHIFLLLVFKAQQQSLLKEVVQFHDPHSSNANGAGLGLWSMSLHPPFPLMTISPPLSLSLLLFSLQINH